MAFPRWIGWLFCILLASCGRNGSTSPLMSLDPAPVPPTSTEKALPPVAAPAPAPAVITPPPPADAAVQPAAPPPASQPLGLLHTSGRDIVDDQGRKVILRGVNLGGWLVPEGYLLKFKGDVDRPSRIEALIADLAGEDYAKKFWAAYRQNYTSEDDIKAIAAAGFNHVRVPFHYRFFLSDKGEDREEGFQLLDHLLEWCDKYRVWVVLDLHCAPGGQTGANIDDSAKDKPELWTDPANQKLTVQLWSRIAARYKDRPVILGYDLLNEPVKPEFSKYNAQLAPLYRTIIAAIRAVDKKHIMFLEGASWGNNFRSFTEPFDPNAVYSFHKYRSDVGLSGIQEYLALGSKHNVPLWCGEFGENNALWYSQCTQLFEDNGIGWCFWPWKKLQSDNGCVSIMLPKGYRKIMAYAKGVGPKPEPAEAIATLDAFLDNLKFAKCERNEDVINSLLGTIPGTVEAEDIGFHGEGVSYHDLEPKNEGGALRIRDGVDIEPSGFNVGWMDDGEWIVYRIVSRETRDYTISFRVASFTGGGQFSIELDGKPVGVPLDVPSTGGWHHWTNLFMPKISIPVGVHQLKFVVVSEGLNFDSMTFE